MAWLLWIKQAIVSNILKGASPAYNKDEVISELYSALEYGEKLIQGENNGLVEMANARGKRQKAVLLDKVTSLHKKIHSYSYKLLLQKLVEEADQRWKILILDQINKSVTGLIKCVFIFSARTFLTTSFNLSPF